MRDVRRNGGGRGLCGGPGKRVDGVFPGRPQSFRHQRRPVDDCSPGRGGMAQNGRTRGGIFHGKMDCFRKNQGWSGMPERDGKDKGEDIAQSKRARAGLLALVDRPQVARTCILRAFSLQMSSRLSLVLRAVQRLGGARMSQICPRFGRGSHENSLSRGLI